VQESAQKILKNPGKVKTNEHTGKSVYQVTTQLIIEKIDILGGGKKTGKRES